MGAAASVSGASLRSTLLRRCDERPLITTAVIAVVVGAGYACWLWTHRRLGAYDPDEAGYLADAFRYHRALTSGHPASVISEIRYSGTAPLVPFLSSLLLLLGPDDPRVASLVQPLLMIVATVSICGVAVRLVRPRTAVLASIALLTLPTTAQALQSYWFGIGAFAAMAAGLWALMSSDRGANRRIWCFGIALAAMVMSRTMALGFVPAMVAAGAVEVGWNRRGALRLASSIGIGVALAAPWYVVQRSVVFDYLFSYGYGDRARLFGTSSPVLRFARLAASQFLQTGLFVPTVVLVAAVPVVAAVRHGEGLRSTVRRLAVRHQPAALLVAAVLGFAALLSTANEGGFFALPLLAPTVPLGACLVERAGRPVRRAGVAAVVAQGVLLLPTAWTILPYPFPIPMPAQHESALEQYDARFAPSHRDRARRAAADWRTANEAVASALRPLGEDGATFTMSGSMSLLNTNSVALAAAIDGWNTDFRVPDTLVGARSQAAFLTPTDWRRSGGRGERVIVVVRGPRHRFTPDERSEQFRTRAIDAGWRVRDSIALPGSGSVEILRRSSAR